MSKTALIVVHEGFEDIETAAPIDVLTRVKAAVTLAAPAAGPVKGAWGVTLIADAAIGEIDGLYDALLLPGGLKNAQGLASDRRVLELISRHHEAGRIIASLCASPSLVLAEAAGILRGRSATGDPAFDDRLAAAGATATKKAVCVDGKLITATGPGTAIPFALTVAAALGCADEANQLALKWGVPFYPAPSLA